MYSTYFHVLQLSISQCNPQDYIIEDIGKKRELTGDGGSDSDESEEEVESMQVRWQKQGLFMDKFREDCGMYMPGEVCFQGQECEAEMRVLCQVPWKSECDGKTDGSNVERWKGLGALVSGVFGAWGFGGLGQKVAKLVERFIQSHFFIPAGSLYNSKFNLLLTEQNP